MAILDTLVRIRAEYPTPLGIDKCVEILNRAAFEHRAEGWGLLFKDSGNNFNARSVDFLVNNHTGMGVDVFRDAGGESAVVWQEKGATDLTRWRAPEGREAPVVVDPTPVPVQTEEVSLDFKDLMVALQNVVESNDRLIVSNEALAKVIAEKQFNVKVRF